MSGALRRLLFIQIKKRLGQLSFGSVFFVRIKNLAYLDCETMFRFFNCDLAINDSQFGYNSPPLSFPKSYIAFSKSKQDVWLRLVLAMDGQQEPVRYKSNLFFGLESESVCLFLWLLSFGHAKESNTPKGRKPKPILSNRLDERRRELATSKVNQKLCIPTEDHGNEIKVDSTSGDDNSHLAR